MDIYKDNKWLSARNPADLGRKDWNHNSEGQVDYLPLGTGMKKTGKEIPYEKQRYDFQYEDRRERAASHIVSVNSRQPDWREYNRIMNDFN